MKAHKPSPTLKPTVQSHLFSPAPGRLLCTIQISTSIYIYLHSPFLGWNKKLTSTKDFIYPPSVRRQSSETICYGCARSTMFCRVKFGLPFPDRSIDQNYASSALLETSWWVNNSFRLSLFLTYPRYSIDNNIFLPRGVGARWPDSCRQPSIITSCSSCRAC